MASVYADPKLRSRRNYIAASTFSGVLYGYSTTLNTQTFNTTGALTVLPTSATSVNGNNKCVQGRILRETGAKLYPDANPGVSTLMVEVYDPNSGIRAYIDPNSPVFAVYNNDKPVEMTDGFEVGTTTAHKGQPVFTTGDVIAGGQIRSYGVTALTGITTNGAQTAQNIDPTLGQVFTIVSAPPSGVASITLNATSAPAGATLTLIIAHTGSNATTFTFGTNMLAASTGTFAPNSTGSWTISFISDGTNFYETARTTVQV
jgi:hypothetical protein